MGEGGGLVELLLMVLVVGLERWRTFFPISQQIMTGRSVHDGKLLLLRLHLQLRWKIQSSRSCSPHLNISSGIAFLLAFFGERI